VQVGAASTSSLALLPVAVTPRRDDVAERAAEQARKQQLASSQVALAQADQPVDREVTRIRTRASAAAQQASSQAQQTLRDLPSRQRGALQTYLSNGPSIQERLGVELAGIDVFA
jgi:hypothetical protein